MTTFGDYATSEYLHYWLADAPDLHLNFAQSKADIMQRHMDKMNTRIKNEAEAMSSASSGLDVSTVESYLRGELFDKVISEVDSDKASDLGNTEHAGSINSFRNISDQAKALVDAGTQGLDDLDQFVSLLQDWFNTLGDNKQAIANAYSKWLEDRIISTRLKSNQYTSQYGEAAQKIIAAILSNTHDSVFTKVPTDASADFGKLNTTEKKMIAVLNYALPAASGSVNYTVNHHDKTIGQQKTTSKGELTMALADKIKKGIEAQHRAAFEVADGLCRYQAASKGFDELSKLSNIKSIYAAAGTKSVQIKFTPDAQQKQIYESIEAGKRSALSRATGKTTSKADSWRTAELGTDTGKFTTTWGLSSKTSYWSWKKDIQTVDIKVQDGTPLLTLLMREAKFSGVQMYDIFQLAGGVGGKKPMGDLEAQWNELMNLAKYEAVLDCIAGIPTENAANGQVYWVNINDIFYTVSDILKNIRDYGDVSLLYSSSSNTSMKGLDRQSYVAINYFVPQTGKTREEAAWERSNRAMKEIPNLMYQTKIRVNISLKEMIVFNRTHGFLRS